MKNKSSNSGYLKRMFYKIKVVTKDTNRVMIHRDVPKDHLEYIRVNPNLDVTILEVYNKGRYRKRVNDFKGSS